MTKILGDEKFSSPIIFYWWRKNFITYHFFIGDETFSSPIHSVTELRWRMLFRHHFVTICIRWQNKDVLWRNVSSPSSTFVVVINTHFNFRSLTIFPSRILECATGFCSSYLFSFGDLHFGELFLAKTKIKSGKIYRHKSMHVSRSS